MHHLQAYMKYGDGIMCNSSHGAVVRHFNDKKADNSYDNILIGTQADNIKDAIRNGSFDYRFKESNSGTKGIHWHKGDKRYLVYNGRSCKENYIGRFIDLEDAKVALLDAIA